MNALKKTFTYTVLLFLVYIAQIAMGSMAESAYVRISVLPAFVMFASTIIPFSHVIFLALVFGIGYEAFALAPFGLSLAGMLAGVVITTGIMRHMKEHAWGSKLLSALAGVLVYAGIIYGGAYYIVRNIALIRIGIWETGMQIAALCMFGIVWGLMQYMRNGKKEYEYHI